MPASIDAAPAPLIRLRSVSKTYHGSAGDVPALQSIDLDVSEGDFIGLMGPSGSGKSTLLHLLGAMDVPSTGDISFDGCSLGRLDDNELSRVRCTRVGFVFQFFNLLPAMSALENVTLPLLAAGRPWKEAKQRAEGALARVGLSSRAAHLPSELSGGELQRAAIARAVVHRPKMLIGDEPTGNLDSVAGEAVLRLLSSLNSEDGMTIVIATHSEEAAAHARRVLHMSDGLLEAP